MVRLEKTFLLDPSTTPSHNAPDPPSAQEQSALLPAKGKLRSLKRWPGSTPRVSQGAPEGLSQAGQPARAAWLPSELPFMPSLPTQAAKTLASHFPKMLIAPHGWAKQQGILPGIPVLKIAFLQLCCPSPHTYQLSLAKQLAPLCLPAYNHCSHLLALNMLNITSEKGCPSLPTESQSLSSPCGYQPVLGSR